MPKRLSNIVVISDQHVGCQMGLCPAGGIPLDGGGHYRPSALQKVVWRWWSEFWRDFVPTATKGEPFVVVNNGDALEGRHHNATTQVSHNLKDQLAAARSVLAPVVDACKGQYYHVRGTEAHVGQSGENEEQLASKLGAIPNEDGHHARWELRLRLGGRLIHFTHHISTSSSPYANTTAIQRELVNSYLETGRWGDEPYSMIVRSHRHQHSEVSWQSVHSKVTGVVSPAWQLKTPFVYRIGARMQQPEIGGLVIRLADGELFVRAFVRRIDPPREERL